MLANLIFHVKFAWMINRRLQIKLEQLLQNNAALAILGPRQVGKTTMAIQLAENRPSIYLDLENKLDLEKIKDFYSFHQENKDKLIILDEIQRSPEIFTQIRGIIDKERRGGKKTGQFLFLGSASLDLLKQSSESLAGRIAYLELHTIDLEEFGQNNTSTHWLRGGFPESLLSSSDEESLTWRVNFIKTYLERDIPQFGHRIPAETLDRFWTMLAHNQGSIFNASQYARNMEVSSMTIGRYLDLMTDLLLVRRLKSWKFNVNKRLVKAPKIYIRDTGLAHALLNIKNYNELLSHPVIGGSWEGFVIENISSVLGDRQQMYYYRTSGGAELDLIIEFSSLERWAVEIKRNSVPSLSKGFYIACEDIGATEKYVIYAGQDEFSMGNGVRAISIVDFMKKILDKQV